MYCLNTQLLKIYTGTVNIRDTLHLISGKYFLDIKIKRILKCLERIC